MKEIKKIKIIKKKEAIIGILAICLMIIGFISYKPVSEDEYGRIADIENYPESNLGEARLVNSNEVEEIPEENNNNVEETSNVPEENPNEEYFLEAKMERNNIYSESIEIYENMLESSSVTSDQKSIAQNEITNITNEKKTIQVAENLIKMKGFEDVVILKNANGINVVVRSDVLLPEQVAQIQNIIEREFQTDSKNINITNK